MLSKVTSQKSLDSGIYPCPSKRRKRKNSSYEPVGRGFESLQARQTKRTLHLQCPFFFWCACPRRRRAMRSPLRDGTVVLKTFHWNVFSTRSTSSARGRRAVCLFLWEIKLRRKRRRCLKQRLFVLAKGSWRFRFAQFNRRAAENVDYFARYSS